MKEGMINKIILTILVLLVVFAVGCAQKVVVNQQPAPVAPETPTTPEEQTPVETPETPVEQEPASPIVETPPTETDDYNWNSIPKAEQRQITSIRKAMDKALGKQENYFYRYTGPDQYQFEYWVKGDKIKIQAVEPVKLDKTTTKDMVYLDREKKTASWYCEHSNMNFCYSGPGPWPAVYSEFIRKTPKEWLEELGQNFRYRFTDNIDGVSYQVIDFTKDGKLVRVWLNSWDGNPLKIDFHPDLDSESEPTASYLFEDMESGLSDDDVTPKV
ncbi:MAG: hypothetical protein KJ574_04955 [Nanoarchaeota archaeon]|nr:hypothetical protein [Nanoarchaeota archaeon]